MRLKTLSESDAANGLLRIVEVGPIIRESTINNGSLGPTTALKEQQEVNLSIGHALRD
jgi:tartrate dehydratase beta subunit/fumarate hydratase class I family protein